MEPMKIEIEHIDVLTGIASVAVTGLLTNDKDMSIAKANALAKQCNNVVRAKVGQIAYYKDIKNEKGTIKFFEEKPEEA